MLTNADVSARIKELVSAVAEKVVASEIRRRNWRVQVLQERVNKILELTEARARMYAEMREEGYEFRVADRDEELMAIEEGCRVKPAVIVPTPAEPAGDWKDLPKDPPPPTDSCRNCPQFYTRVDQWSSTRSILRSCRTPLRSRARFPLISATQHYSGL